MKNTENNCKRRRDKCSTLGTRSEVATGQPAVAAVAAAAHGELMVGGELVDNGALEIEKGSKRGGQERHCERKTKRAKADWK